MTMTIDIRELPGRIEEVLAIAASGDEVLVTDGGTPRARLVPCESPGPRRPGLHVGAIQTSPDFDAPLPDDFWIGEP